MSGAITIDGSLDDPGWKGVPGIEKWYETNPGDNTPPKVRNVGYLAYDDKYFYAAFEFDDPSAKSIRAPYGDRDTIGSPLDYGGVILDARNTRRTAILFLVNPRGIQYDAVTDDSSGEDSSPDFYWDSAARITDKGWQMEMRIPFSSLRYPKTDPQTWAIMLYRNYPREFRYQFFSTTLPKSSNCFICRSNPLESLSGLPKGGGIVAAPYAAGGQQWKAPDDTAGRPLHRAPFDGNVGLDVKWRPSANTAIDGTVNPDFSQIESDVALISANERFALFFPEKRPFFLEGIELFSTPIQAVYTRTITSPDWGVRGTGKFGAVSYTTLAAQDGGGGSVILPGPLSSDLADQDFRSWIGLFRLKREFGRSFVSALAVDREIDGSDGGGHNRVFGPDFRWQHAESDTLTGQLLFSQSRTPNRTDLTDQWDGRDLSGHAAMTWYSHNSKHYDFFTQFQDLSADFRADSGFVPQVGYRQEYVETGWTIRPTGFVRRERFFTWLDHQTDNDNNLIQQFFTIGTGLDARFNTFLQVRYNYDKFLAGEQILPRHSATWNLQMVPGRVLSQIQTDGRIGQEIDFSNNRRGHGISLNFSASLRPTDHLAVTLNNSRRYVDVDDAGGNNARLFTARVDRIRATYTLNARSFVRGIAQWVDTTRDPSLYIDEVDRHTRSFGGTFLLAYKLNWQTVLFLGYGDNQELDEREELKPLDRSLFMKISYAFQR